MAEHLNQPKPPVLSAFGMMGKPLSPKARQAGYDTCKEMGLDSDRAMGCVNGVCEQLERDQPYEAQSVGMRYVDLTGWYRLVAVILTAAATEEVSK